MGTRNKLTDLNNHLFEQLERLNDESLDGEAIDKEVTRSKAITDIATKIIASGELAIKALKVNDGRIDITEKLPRLFEKVTDNIEK